MRKLFISLVAVVGLASMLHADTWNKKTELTVRETVEVPGAILPPGNYVVKLADSAANRHIVMFMNEREDEVLSTVLAIPNERMRPSDKSSFSFYERPGGEPPAMRAWFYPGDLIGQEFAYPEREARQIAQATGQQVLTIPDDRDQSAAERTTVTKPVASESTTTKAQAENRPAGPTGGEIVEPDQEKPDPAMLAQANPPPQATQQGRPVTDQADPDAAQTTAQEADTLPDTASLAPLLGLIGLLSMGGALGLRTLAKHASRRS